MKFTINKKEYEAHYSFRMLMLYEQIHGKTIDFQNITLNDLVLLFYTCVISTLQYNKANYTMGYEDFLNWLDDNEGEKKIVEFTNWYVQELKIKEDLASPKKDEPNDLNLDPNF